MPSLGWLPFQQAKNPIDAATESAGAVTNIFDAINRAKTSAVQRALAQQELQHQIAIAPLQQQAEELQNQSEAAKLPYIGPTAQANIAGLYALGGLRSATANNKNAVTPSIVDKNEAAAGLAGQRGDLIGQAIDQNNVINPIKVKDAKTRSDALPEQIQDNLGLIKQKMADLGVHTHNAEVMGPILAGHMDAVTQSVLSHKAKDDAATAAMQMALSKGTNSGDWTSPEKIAEHWDFNDPNALPDLIKYTQAQLVAKNDKNGAQTTLDANYANNFLGPATRTATGIANELQKQQQNEMLSQQFRQRLMQLLGGGQRPGQTPPAAPGPVAPPQAAPPLLMPQAPIPGAAPPVQASPQGAPQYPEGAIFRLPSTGQRFKIINGQPVEIPPNAGSVAPN